MTVTMGLPTVILGLGAIVVLIALVIYKDREVKRKDKGLDEMAGTIVGIFYHNKEEG